MGMLLRVTATSAKAGERCDETSRQPRHSQSPGSANTLLPDESQVLIKLRLDYDYSGLRSPFQPTAEKKKQAVPFRGPIPALPRHLETLVSHPHAGCHSRRAASSGKKR